MHRGLLRPAYYGLRHMQEFVERDGAFRNSLTRAAVDKELRVMVKDIDDESGCSTAPAGTAACIQISKSPIHAREIAAASPPSGRDSRLTYAREILNVVRLYSNAPPTKNLAL